jgi:hypothetical protein
MNTLPFSTPRMACFPGGPARQFRVQILDPQSAVWQHIASYTRPEGAQDCLSSLTRKGYQARVVSFCYCPIAG